MHTLSLHLSSLFILLFPSAGFSQSQSCFTCQFPITAQQPAAGEVDACVDLFAASCLDKSGNAKYNGMAKVASENGIKIVREARNKGAQALGYKNIEDAIKTKLLAEGIVLKSPPDKGAWDDLVDGTSSHFSSNSGAKLYATIDQCNKDLQYLQGLPFNSSTDVHELKKIASQFRSFESKYKELSIKVFAKDISNFISGDIGEKCSTLKSNSPSYKPEENKEIAKACKNIGQLRQKAIELYRIEGTPEYKAKAEQFVRENILPELHYSSDESVGKSPKVAKSEIDKLRDVITAINNRNNSFCATYGNNVEVASRKIVGDLFKNLSRSKPTVEALIDKVYNKEREKKGTEIFLKVKADIQDLTKSLVKDQQKRANIIDGYDNMKLYWMEKPDESAYTKDKNGLIILDENKVSDNPIDTAAKAFFDPQLSFFTTTNAFYTPSRSYGKSTTSEQLDIMPILLATLDSNPYTYLAVVAHEAGHKIGPHLSVVNGHDMTSVYRELLACYQGNKSINMTGNQADEIMADYFSSEVLAREIEKLPREQRKQALMSSMQNYCVFDDTSNEYNMIDFNENHPESILRVGGIFGANPSIRKVLGCQQDSPKYKTCGLKVSILDCPESAIKAPRSSPLSFGDTQNPKTEKGVR